MSTLKEKFENYLVQPDPKVWESINTSLIQHRTRRRWLLTSSSAAVGVGAVALLFALNGDNDNSSTVSKGVMVAQNNTEIITPQEATEMFTDANDVAPVHSADVVPAEYSCDFSTKDVIPQSVAADVDVEPVEVTRRDEIQQVNAVQSLQPSAPAKTITSSSEQNVVVTTEAQPKSTAKANSQPVQENPTEQTITIGNDSKVPSSELAVWIPNAFSPDDPVEESARTFKVFPNNDANIRTFEIFIYSRTGRMVYHSKDYKQGWDGTANGKPQPMGTYVYIIELNDVNKGLQHTKGTITLLR